MKKLTMPAAIFRERTHLNSTGKTYDPGTVILPPLPADAEAQKQWFNTKKLTIVPMGDIFREYDIQQETGQYPPRILFTHLGGGIGDIIAFSAITHYFNDRNIKVYCSDKLFPVFDWFREKPKLFNYFDPIVHSYGISTKFTIYKLFARMPMEYAAIEAGSVNWYDAMFQRIGFEKAPDGYARPYLNLTAANKSKYIKKDEASLIISHRASCQMRSSEFKDFYYPVKSACENYKLYVHETDLTESDKQFIAESAKDVTIITKCTLPEYFDNLFWASMVVCTDSAAIHFREGVRKQCLAAFGAMTTQSRTSGYKYTRSFNTASECTFQPCFLHELIKGQVCSNAKQGDSVAKCQSGENFQAQLYNELYKYLTGDNDLEFRT